MHNQALVPLLCVAIVSLFTGCSGSPLLCLHLDMKRGDGPKVRQIAARIAKDRDMVFADKSVEPEPETPEEESLYFQLAGGGIVGHITAKLLGKPLVGIDVLGSHRIGQRARICFYGKKDDPDLHRIVDDFTKSLGEASIKSEKEIRQPK